VTSTAFIDVGAASGATGIAEAPAGNGSVPQSANAGASADFRSNWQAILNALAGANPVIGTQAPSSQLREALLQSNAKTIAQQGTTSLLSQVSADTQQARSASPASRSDAASHQPRREHAQKLAANHDQLSVGSTLAAGFDAAAAAAPVVGAPLPASIKASPVVKDGLRFVESEPEAAQPAAVADLASAPLSEFKANAFTSRANQAGEDTSDETVLGLGMQTDSSSTSNHLAVAADENVVASEKLSGKAQSATTGAGAVHVRSAESRPAPAQSLAAHAAPTVDDTPIRSGEEGTAPKQSETAIAAATSLPGSHSEFAGAPKIAAGSGTASTTGTQYPSGAANPATLDSAIAAQQARGEVRPQQASEAGARVVSASLVRQTTTTSGAAAAGVSSSARTLPPSYSAHAQNPAEATDPLTAAALTKSDGANDLRVARDETQPQGTMGSTVHDAFAALDTRTADAATTWLQTGTHHAEAGYLDPSLGWVGVRAESSGSALHAAILPGSGEAAQALGGHLTALNSFMAEQHGRSSTVTLASPDQNQMQSGFSHSGGHSGEGSAQRQSHDGQARSDAAAFTSQAARATGTRTQAFANPDAHVYARDGVHISVIA
jgi:hypothetical protein